MSLAKRPFSSTLVVLTLALGIVARGARGEEPIGPYGLRGTLFLLGRGDTTGDAARKRFVESAGGAKADIVVISSNEPAPEISKTLFGANARWIRPNFDMPAADLAKATAVWIEGDFPSAARPKLAESLQAVLRRGGKAACRASLSEGLISGAWISELDARSDETAFAQEVEKHRGRFGIGLRPGAVLVVQDRQMRMLQGEAVLGLGSSASRPAKLEKVGGAREEDLNQWRRAALARTQAPYPPKTLETPEAKKGTLIVIGGGGMPEGSVRRFIEAAGGPEAPIVVLPTSMPDPLPAMGGDAFLRKAGAKHVHVMNARARADVEDPANLDWLRKARGIWFGGGRQWRFVDAYEGTQAYSLIRDVLDRGGVIGGGSAGATIQGDYLVRGSPLGPEIMMAEGYEKAFGFLPGVAIDQHFAQRKRFGDMTALMKSYPQFLGIGLDEATGIVVQGRIAEIIGRGEVHFYDAAKMRPADGPDHDSYKAGTRYDLAARRPVVEGK